jgi:hypothetical protein
VSIKVHIVFTDRAHPNRASTLVVGREVPFEGLQLGDVTTLIEQTQAHLSRITGLVVKIETGAE